ncbi:arginine--tRNA ligase [Albibacterium bauzanense]|uniref:Arginine--tRNA ligase n=1 Tax=Albibacterium bauzanense TaxID=653929 RepID=A0A4R1M0L0_9SPHI|nr:arginine--tRNA ligase [Albibacterium bauzanense]TCK85436.1 arginyl-tRNA synthetase [Albibacterium bauzanense]
MNIQNQIIKVTQRAVKDLYAADLSEDQISLQETRKEFEGHFTLVTFPIIRFSKKSPEQTGQEIGEYLKNEIDSIVDFNIIKGFLNLVLSSDYWFERLQTEITDPDHGFFPKNGKKLMLEYSSPNTNKPLHLGHIRNNLLGYSVAEILKAYGYEVIKANLVNDRGIHICKSMLSWKLYGDGETPESSGLKGDHLVGKYYVRFDKEYKKQIKGLISSGHTEEEAKKNAPLIKEAQSMLQKWEAHDPEVVELWRMMNGWVYAGFAETYKQLGVDFDKYYYESDTYLLGKDIIQEGLESGVFYKKDDNSVWIDLTDDGLDEKLVLRGDGTSVYITQDLGTAQLKYDDFKIDESIYVVGNEQDYHFKVLFLILKKLGKSWAEGLFHLSYGMVDLPSGKMKSREGTVVDADDLIEEMISTAKARTEELGKVSDFSSEEKEKLYYNIGLGALKYFLLKVEPKKRLLFDPNESIDFQGHTGPFIQYTYARINSVLNKSGFNVETIVEKPTVFKESELDLIQLLDRFPEKIEASAKEFSPAQLANYIYDLSKLYNKFYHEESILKAEDEHIKNFRLKLSKVTALTIAKGMKLLGIDVPERM